MHVALGALCRGAVKRTDRIKKGIWLQVSKIISNKLGL